MPVLSEQREVSGAQSQGSMQNLVGGIHYMHQLSGERNKRGAGEFCLLWQFVTVTESCGWLLEIPGGFKHLSGLAGEHQMKCNIEKAQLMPIGKDNLKVALHLDL